MKKPTHLFRAMSAAEVEELWTKLRLEADEAKRQYDNCMTSDGEGVRFCMREAADSHWHKMGNIDHARHVLIEMLSRRPT